MNRKKLNQELKSIIDEINQVQAKIDARKFVEKYCKFINSLVLEKDYHIEQPNETSGDFVITNSDYTHSLLVNLRKFTHVNNDVESILELFVLKGTYTDERRNINVSVDTIEGLSEIISRTVTWLGDKIDSRKITKAYDIVLSDERISKVFGKTTLEAIHLRSSMNNLIDKIERFIEFEKTVITL